MALYFYFNETTGDLVYSDQATYSGDGYTSLGEQTNMNPIAAQQWRYNAYRSDIKSVTKDSSLSKQISELESMFYMFNDCENLISVDLSGFNTSNVTTMESAFDVCSSLRTLDLSSFDTSNVTDMSYMFNGCSSLRTLDLSSFDTSNVTNMQTMFNACSNLTTLDLSSFNISNTTITSTMFIACDNLRLITIGDNVSKLLTSLPASQYYPAAGGDPVAKADLTAGTWVRDEADLSMVTSIVEQAQMSQAISRRIGRLNRDLRQEIAILSSSSSTPSVDIVKTTAHSTSYTKDTLEIVCDSTGKVTAMYFISV